MTCFTRFSVYNYLKFCQNVGYKCVLDVCFLLECSFFNAGLIFMYLTWLEEETGRYGDLFIKQKCLDKQI